VQIRSHCPLTSEEQINDKVDKLKKKPLFQLSCGLFAIVQRSVRRLLKRSRSRRLQEAEVYVRPVKQLCRGIQKDDSIYSGRPACLLFFHVHIV